jgi:hypothetical protein
LRNATPASTAVVLDISSNNSCIAVRSFGTTAGTFDLLLPNTHTSIARPNRFGFGSFQKTKQKKMDAELQPHLQNETQVIRHAGREAIRQFLETHNCFAVLRTSGKVVVFDTRIPIQLAFYALVEHGTC